MSKSLSILVYLKRQKKDPDGKMPLNVRVTIDGDNADFALSRRILPDEWSQPKQKSISKTAEALHLNSKIAKTKGDLTALFDRMPVSETVKSKQLIKLYHGNDSEKKQQLKKDLYYHQQVLIIINQYLALKNKERKAHQKPNEVPQPDRIAKEFDTLIQSIEDFLQQSRVWMDDPVVEKTLMDAQYTFLLKFLYKVLKGTASHETFRKWVSTKNIFASFLRYRCKIDDQLLKGIRLKLAVDLNGYLTVTNSIGNNAAMKYIKNLKQVIDDAVVQGWLAQNPLESFKCTYVDPERKALTLEEIAKVIDHSLDNPRLNEVRDVFVFCCFTGFAYQEVYGLRPKDVEVGIDGKNWINTTRNKTKNPEFLPLLPIGAISLSKISGICLNTGNIFFGKFHWLIRPRFRIKNGRNIRKTITQKMGYIKEPAVDFVFEQRSVTAEDRRIISEAIAHYKATGKFKRVPKPKKAQRTAKKVKK